ncbi:hypothetical protein ACKI1K_45465, partial [Streptomyces scabiei]|uniref:hypothetical protein n=1 Tax=Streptomyces scabiei TaxID=1930 RepID=UPI0038F7FE0B
DYTEVWRVQNLRAIMRQEVNKALPQFYNEIDVEIDEDGNFYYTVYTNERQIKRSDVPPSFNATPMKPRYLNTDLSGPLFVTGS